VREIGFLIWALVVVFGVVSSIVQSARKRAAQTSLVPKASAQRLDEVRRLSQQIVVNAGRPGQVQAPVRAAGTAVRTSAPAPKPPAPRAPATPSARVGPAAEASLGLPLFIGDPPSGPRLRFSHLFGSRRKVADAFVVSEVIGKPLALRNE
jgi:hypothetical protein